MLQKMQFQIDELEKENRVRSRAIKSGKMRVVDGYRSMKESQEKVRRMQKKLRELQKTSF